MTSEDQVAPLVPPKKRGRGRLVAAIVVIAILLVAGGVSIFGAPDWMVQLLGNVPFIGNLLTGAQPGFTFQVHNPAIGANGTDVSFPPNYSILAQYALDQINVDRAAQGLSAVELSSEPSGQQHADSMLYYGYFSHWDVAGFKPYMRYSLLNGTGAVEENVAVELYSTPNFFTVKSIEGAIKDLEYQMVYNDSAENNGHRDNILDAFHNFVSIGVAYDTTHVYLVQDFENIYLNFTQPLLSGNQINIEGTLSRAMSFDSVYVFYDPAPSNLSVNELGSNPSYTGSYGPGGFAGGATPPCVGTCQYFPGYLTVRATVWSVSSGSVDITFSLSPFVQKYGNGVYTVYLRTPSGEFMTSYSIFVG
jgi:uncharacterized protein YkwD